MKNFPFKKSYKRDVGTGVQFSLLTNTQLCPKVSTAIDSTTVETGALAFGIVLILVESFKPLVSSRDKRVDR